MFEVEALNNTREADAVAGVLGDAFTHDPAYRYILAGATDHVSSLMMALYSSQWCLTHSGRAL